MTNGLAFFSAMLLVLLFGYAAASKFAEYQRFVDQMQLAPLPLMKTMAPFLGWVVPLSEIVIVILLFSERHRNKALLLSFLLLLAFQIYIAVMLLSGLDLPCTCGGLISKLQWRQHLVFNAVFMFIAIFPLVYQRFVQKHQSNRYSAQSI